MVDIALEINVDELLARDPLTSNDFAEIRREVYRSESARDAFVQLLESKYPENAKDEDTQLRRGVGMLAAGRYEAAIAALEKLKSKLAAFLLGRHFLDQDDAESALPHLKNVSGKGDPAEFQVCYGEALARNGDLAGLRKMAAQLQEADPQGAEAAYLEGRILEIEGDYQAAVASYERAVAIQPDHRDARFRLAYRVDLMGRDEDAISHYERLRQIFPVPVGALLNLGVLYEDQGNYEKAASCYKLALVHDGTNELARMYKADAELSMEMYYDEEKERKDDKRAQILKIPVTDFELSVRSRNCLARMNIRTLGDLIKKSEAELLSFKNFGETSLNEIKEILRTKGLRLGMSHDDDDRRGSRRHRELDRDSVRAKSIADLDLSVRSRKALDTLKIATVGQLTEISEEQLMACKNFGQTSLVEIKKKLADHELSLRG